MQDQRISIKKELVDYSYDEYCTLKDSGMMWEFYPEATGGYQQDTGKTVEEGKKQSVGNLPDSFYTP